MAMAVPSIAMKKTVPSHTTLRGPKTTVGRSATLSTGRWLTRSILLWPFCVATRAILASTNQ